MVYAVARHIVTPLADTVEGNVNAILAGRTALACHTDVRGEPLQEPVTASLFASLPHIEGYTDFESLCIEAVQTAVTGKGIDLQSNRCVFILSSTKGEIWESMAQTAGHISSFFGNAEPPVVVSTACTSGVSAQIAAYRLLESGMYDTAVVFGCDLQNEFIISGFQSFHALSANPCRPFDRSRDGLNPGEAVAVLVLSTRPPQTSSIWRMDGGSVHNDANHISGPSRTGEGSLRCLQDMTRYANEKDLAFVSVHGTGTPYNDEMESIALHRAGLDETPVSALKGYYGHTMGAAGLLETILSMAAVEKGIILPSKGFTEQGTTYTVNLSNDVRTTNCQSFVKLLSGFGGINAAVCWTHTEDTTEAESVQKADKQWNTVAENSIPHDEPVESLYRREIGDYPKFYKMDRLSRLGFAAVQMLLKKAKEQKPAFLLDTERCGILLANHWSSVHNDRQYQQTIADKQNYFPSPALFVYTLPNIVTGETAIYNHLFGETMFYVLPDEQDMDKLVAATIQQSDCKQLITGWVEYEGENNYQANVRLIEIQ